MPKVITTISIASNLIIKIYYLIVLKFYRKIFIPVKEYVTLATFLASFGLFAPRNCPTRIFAAVAIKNYNSIYWLYIIILNFNNYQLRKVLGKL